MLDSAEADRSLSLLVHHALGAANAPVILEYAPRAAEQAGQHGAHREAARYLQSALDHAHLLEPEERAALLRFQEWFGDSDLVRIEQTEIHRVGEKLSILYRLLLRKQGEWFEVEQHIAGFLRDDAFSRLDLLCSGFQPVPSPGDALTADAFLRMDAPAENQGSTCAILTPAIKMKLRDMSSGQLLKVQVEDTTARGDIEAWCRLSGNELLAVSPAEGGQGFCYFLRKK
jgi:TusA-related sulfurtransferase